MNKLKLISILFFSAIVLSACSPFDELADEINGWLGSEGSGTDETETTETTTTETGSDDEDTIERLDFSHLMNKGQETSLDEGVHRVGKDVEPGRYKITADEGAGTGGIYINDEEDSSFFSATLTEGTTSRADSIIEMVTFLDEDYEIEVTGIESVTLTPYETQDVTTLVTGQWIAGEDFPAGVYDISTTFDETVGDIMVTQVKGMSKSRHSIGNEEYGGMTDFTMSFVDDDFVELEYVPEVTLSKR